LRWTFVAQTRSSADELPGGARGVAVFLEQVVGAVGEAAERAAGLARARQRAAARTG
jgi:hypothetical protein